MKIIERCPECGKAYLVQKYPVLVHVTLSILTLGLWLLLWLYISWKEHLSAKCPACNKERAFVSK